LGDFTDALRRARRARGTSLRDAGPGREPAEKLDPEAPPGAAEPFEDSLGEALEAWILPDARAPEPARESGGADPLALRDDKRGRWHSRAVVADRTGSITESYRHLGLRVRAELERRGVRSLAVVSALRNDGKTTLSCNLALALASLSRQREVALVEFDLRAPGIATAFGIPKVTGIEAALEHSGNLASVRVPIEKPALDVYPARAPHDAAHELLVRPEAAVLVRELERRYAVVVFDTPPVLLVPDASLLLRHAAAYATVARAGVTRVRAFRQMLELLPREKLLGGILNDGSRPTYTSQYGYYRARAAQTRED
jgi:Mrp family chromosome partitioning ATPase